MTTANHTTDGAEAAPSLHSARLRSLRLARELLDPDDMYFICWALDDVGQKYPELETTCEKLQDEVHWNLEGYETLTNWLVAQCSFDTMPDMHLARCAWLDKMIADEEAHHEI